MIGDAGEAVGQPAGQPRRYLKTHNAIRGLAALGVFLYHLQLEAAYRVPLGIAASIVSRSYVWVDLFFILSGFVLSLTYLEGLGRPTPSSLRLFFAARIARILPMHLFALGYVALLVFGTTAVAELLGRAPYWPWVTGTDIANLGLQAMLLQTWSHAASLSWNIPSWSISAEMHVYLLMPLMAVALRKAPRLSACVLLLLSAAIYTGLLLNRSSLDILGPLALLRCLAGFALGIVLHQLVPEGLRIADRLLSALQVIVIAAMIAILVSPMHDIWLIPTLAMLIVLTASDRGVMAGLLAGKLPQTLGNISYSLYLLNYPVLMTAGMLWPRVEPLLGWLPPIERRLVWMGLLILVIVSISRLTFKCVEGPLRDRTKRILSGGARAKHATGTP